MLRKRVGGLRLVAHTHGEKFIAHVMTKNADVENSVLQVSGVPLVVQAITPGKYDELSITAFCAGEKIVLVKKRAE